MKQTTLAWFPLSLCLLACDGNDQEPAGVSSGSPQYLVVEGGFECPAELPARFSVGPREVCMSEGFEPSDLSSAACANLGDCRVTTLGPADDLNGSELPVEQDPGAVPAPAPALLPPSSDTAGLGACANTTVRALALASQALIPERLEVPAFEFDPGPVYTGQAPGPAATFYRAVVHENSVSLAFRACTGKVSDDWRCLSERIWFFETNGECEPQAAGTYAVSPGDGCYEVTGEVKAEFSELALPERKRCDFDPQSEKIGGSDEVMGFGLGTFCGDPVRDVVPMSLNVEQGAADLSQANVTLTGSGHACLDGIPFAGLVIGTTVEAELPLAEAEGRLAADLCAAPAKINLTMGYGDEPLFGGNFPGYVAYSSLDGDGCDGTGPTYTERGSYHLSLSAK